ncbi:hypothetical protein AAEX63_03235 [Luteococcus sp. H138]|uniref:hypothetical protein n=1 Tax=unclassified Luteococcus TaxID=2639923 RepID=UPI00313ADF97
MHPRPARDPSTEGNLFAERLTQALGKRNLPLSRVQARLVAMDQKVSVASLSYWANGRSLPTRARSYGVVQALEIVLGLEPGDLTGAIDTGPQNYPLATILHRDELLAESVRQHNLPSTQLWNHDAISHMVLIDRDSCERAMTTKLALRAVTPGAQNWAIVVERIGKQDIEAHGDHIAPLRRQIRIAPDLTILEFGLDNPLERGQTVVTEHQINFPAGNTPSKDSGYALRATAKLLSLTVEFLDELPRQIYRTFQSPGDDAPVRIDQPLLIREGTVHYALTDALPGMHAIAWEW